jgi:CubicO group peptidase (beta-lactamase class C family)
MPPGSDLLSGRSFLSRYLSYVIKNGIEHSPDEYRLFPSKKTAIPPLKAELPENCKEGYLRSVKYYSRGIITEEETDSFFTRTDSTAFLLMKDGKVICEKYYNGFKRDSIFRIYSITKSFISVLLGIAIEEKLIKGVEDKITLYLPELKKNRFAGELTIKDVLLMNMGIRMKDGYAPWHGEAKAYLSPDCRSFALNCRIDRPGTEFHYNDYHPLLLGLILERVAGQSVTDYLYNALWSPMGAEYEAFFSCDSTDSMFEKAESGLNIRAVDLLRFGKLLLGEGRFNGKQIIPSDWIAESTSPLSDNNSGRYSYYKDHPWGKLVFSRPENYYKYHWWGKKTSKTDYDYYALGVLGQVLYISPSSNMVAIRLGNKWNVSDWWPRILQGIIADLNRYK